MARNHWCLTGTTSLHSGRRRELARKATHQLETSKRRFDFWHWMAALLICVGGGCLDSGDQYVPAEHNIPAHKPKNFLEAVRRIEQFIQMQLPDAGSSSLAGSSMGEGSTVDQQQAERSWREFGEWIGWLEELATDSDLDEQNWTTVRETAQAMSTWLAQTRELDSAARLTAWASDRQRWQSWLNALQRVADEYDRLQKQFSGAGEDLPHQSERDDQGNDRGNDGEANRG